ncbi:MAG: hypothetical protein IPL08_09585 [Saprospiraceae bacterium]|nr:hypothetical protein [Saprospiraceae bacterium]
MQFSSITKIWLGFICLSINLLPISYAQHSDWQNVTYPNNILSAADDGNDVWLGTDYGGLISIDKSNGSKTFLINVIRHYQPMS